MILSLLPSNGNSLNIKELMKFDSTFTLNSYEGIIIQNIIQPEVKKKSCE